MAMLLWMALGIYYIGVQREREGTGGFVVCLGGKSVERKSGGLYMVRS